MASGERRLPTASQQRTYKIILFGVDSIFFFESPKPTPPTDPAMAATTTLTQAQPVLHLNGGVETAKNVDDPTNHGAPGPDYKYARFLPSFDQSYKLPPLEPFEHTDPGLAALNDPEPRSFLRGAEVIELTPKFGSEVEGIQLSKLDQKAKRCAASAASAASSVVTICRCLADHVQPTRPICRSARYRRVPGPGLSRPVAGMAAECMGIVSSIRQQETVRGRVLYWPADGSQHFWPTPHPPNLGTAQRLSPVPPRLPRCEAEERLGVRHPEAVVHRLAQRCDLRGATSGIDHFILVRHSRVGW
jgi:hypothetical protein